MSKLICISGHKSSGKDTIGLMIQYLLAKKNNPALTDHYDIFKRLYPTYEKEEKSGYKIKKFADKVTESFKVITKLDYHSVCREFKEEFRIKYREYAESCKDVFGRNIWAVALFESVDMRRDKIIITDLRFKEELDFIRRYKNSIIIKKESKEEPTDQHISENDLKDFKDWDFIIPYTDNKEELLSEVQGMLETLDII